MDRQYLLGRGPSGLPVPIAVDADGHILISELNEDITVDGAVGIKGYRSSDATYQPIRLDRYTNTIQTIDYSHHEIHAGSHWFVTDYQTIANGASVDWLITTPNTTRWAHLTFEVQGSAITQIDLYENTDKTGTTGLTVVNNDRNSIAVSTTTVARGTAGGTTDGLLIWKSKGGAATAQFRAGADNREETEIILKQNCKYILRVTSGTDSNLVAVKLRWYEHVNL